MKKIFLIIIAAISTLAYSCKDSGDDTPTPPASVGGLGGAFSIATFPKHHDKPIPNAVIYIKYDATAFPGADVTKYDDHKVVESEPGEGPHAHFSNLKAGNYYFYGVGYDSTISMSVTGGIPVVITSKNATNTDITVPVTEGVTTLYSLAAFPKHHNKAIPGTVVYIKYNATTFPGTDLTKYDDHKTVESEPGEDPHAHFSNLLKGNYYLYGVGYDSTISMPVKGGIPVVITDNSATETDVTVPVTE